MKWLILGALLGLLLVFPQLPAIVAAAVLSQPVAVAFTVGLTAGTRMRRTWRER